MNFKQEPLLTEWLTIILYGFQKNSKLLIYTIIKSYKKLLDDEINEIKQKYNTTIIIQKRISFIACF